MDKLKEGPNSCARNVSDIIKSHAGYYYSDCNNSVAFGDIQRA